MTGAPLNHSPSMQREHDHTLQQPALAALSPDVTQCPAQAWLWLSRAVHDRHMGFHTPTLITLANGGEPDGRVVVLRKADQARSLFMAHTDVRSDKARMIQTRSAHASANTCAWVFYDARLRLQIRARGTLSLHTNDALADAQWLASTLHSRRCYLAPHAPGSEQAEIDHNLPIEVRDRAPTLEESHAGRVNFGVLVSRVHSFDMLHLGSKGHSRCVWEVSDAGEPVRMRWLAP
jgi:pyridoxine/pyridoxamine 5'-phosphate oxidase